MRLRHRERERQRDTHTEHAHLATIINNITSIIIIHICHYSLDFHHYNLIITTFTVILLKDHIFTLSSLMVTFTGQWTVCRHSPIVATQISEGFSLSLASSLIPFFRPAFVTRWKKDQQLHEWTFVSLPEVCVCVCVCVF